MVATGGTPAQTGHGRRDGDDRAGRGPRYGRAVELEGILQELRDLPDLPRLVVALGQAPLWDRYPGQVEVMVVGQTGELPWLGTRSPSPERAVATLGRRLVARGRQAVVLAIDPASRRLAVGVALDEVPLLSLHTAEPDPVALRCLRRLSAGGKGPLAYVSAAAEALRGESAGRRFFAEFRATLERMAARLPGPLRADDRRAFALLQLTRVLFLYFVQSKGWLAGRERFLADAVDQCLAGKRRLHRDLLRPLFFGTLNRPAAERGRAAARFGAIPFLNGGLFEPHPLERRCRADIPNDVWRDAFDGLFERFHFTVAEGRADGRIAPDMLGRVFEGVMAPEARHASGTYYTPAALVRRLLNSAFVAILSHRAGCSAGRAERMLAERHPEAWLVLERVVLLDPAAGSGAFLLGALEALARLSPRGDGSAARREVLRRNLFGVDLSAMAVRLSELRLWLAVIADDPTERPHRVHPLPNLDCMVRQGDSLIEPVGAGLRLPAEAAAIGGDLALVRPAVVTASGREKRAALRRLAALEARATGAWLGAGERSLGEDIAECLRDARSGDLFGRPRGLDRELRQRLADLRRELHAVRRARRTLARDGEVPWFHYQAHFADVFARGGFDLVVGNPPWLRAEELAPALRGRLARRYRWWRAGGRGYANRADLALAFLERAFELAAPDGVVAMLVPAKLATAGYGAAARHGLAAGATLVHVADLGCEPTAVFEATAYPLALVARKTRPGPRQRVATRLEPSGGHTVPQTALQGGGPWVLVREPVRRALAELAREHPRLDATFICHLGLKTGANAVFLDPPDDVEPDLIRDAVRGRDVQPFRAGSRRRLLYTHGPDGKPLAALPPHAAAYLASRRDALRGRADYAGGPPWTLFRTGPATAPHRVVWPDLARHLSAAALDTQGDRRLVPLNTCYVIPAGSAEQAARLTSWLNSTWVRAAARAGAVPAAGGYARYTAGVVGAIPLPVDALACGRLATLADAGRRGEPVQDELDEITATLLGLSSAARASLRRYLAGRTDDRG